MPTMCWAAMRRKICAAGTNMPPHNLNEVIDATCEYIDNFDISVDELMKFVKGPDFPTGAYIMGLEGIKQAYHTGRGKITVSNSALPP